MSAWRAEPVEVRPHWGGLSQEGGDGGEPSVDPHNSHAPLYISVAFGRFISLEPSSSSSSPPLPPLSLSLSLSLFSLSLSLPLSLSVFICMLPHFSRTGFSERET